MSWLQEIMIQCPQCGEEFAIQIETAEDGIVEMIEDCAVCCRPATVRITTEKGEVTSVDVVAA
ncbi:MAG: CPXCG motif-containing cysteine-rich protein [Verrucomicrobiota bacterium]